MTIRAKILLGYVATLALVGAAALYGLQQLERRLEVEVGESSLGLAASLLDRIENRVYVRAEQVRELVSTTQMLDAALAASNQRLGAIDSAERAALIAQLDAEWRTGSAAAGALPPVILAVEAEPLSALLRDKVDFFRQETGFPVFGEVFVTNRFGVNVAETQITSDFRQDDEAWWQAGSSQPLWLSPVGFDDSSGVFSIDFAARVIDRDGALLGVLKAVLNIEEVYRILSAFEASSPMASASVSLHDDRGTLLYPRFVAAAASGPAAGAEAGFAVTAGSLTATVRSQGSARYPALGWTLAVRYDTGEILAPIRQLRRRFLAVALALLVISAVVGFVVAASIARPIRQSASVAESLAGGDLALAIETRGSGEGRQLLDAMRAMLDKLRSIIGGLVTTSREIRQSADRLGTSSRRIVAGAEDQSAATAASTVLVREMAGSIEEVARSADQMMQALEVTTRSIDDMVRSMSSIDADVARVANEVGASRATIGDMVQAVDRVAARAEAVGDASQAALEEARRGGAAVVESKQGMTELSATIEQLVAVHAKLDLSSRRIHHITEVIERIAAQTNLLAINAAIQASQAGVHGSSFAVVAQELRILSESTAESAKNIGKVVEEVRADTEGASALTERCARQARRGSSLAADAGSALERIVGASHTASEDMQSIVRDTAGQTRIAQEMVGAFEKIGAMAVAVEEETARHAQTSDAIRQAMTSLGPASQRVRAVIKRHRHDGGEMSRAIERIAAASRSNVETSAVLVEVTQVLEVQAAALSSLASFFRQPADEARDEGPGARAVAGDIAPG